MRDVLREEKKFLLNQAEALKLRNYLSNVVHTDSHNGLDGYQVRSLYFDSLSNRDFQEKEDGLELRRKLRLRVYSPELKCRNQCSQVSLVYLYGCGLYFTV